MTSIFLNSLELFYISFYSLIINLILKCFSFIIAYDRDVRDRIVTLSVIQHGQVFLLCVLKHGEIQQVNLNLIFDKGDDITFTVGGYGKIYCV